jgi:hypothetical protein
MLLTQTKPLLATRGGTILGISLTRRTSRGRLTEDSVTCKKKYIKNNRLFVKIQSKLKLHNLDVL